DPVAEPLALAVYKYVLLAGGNAFFRMSPSGASEIFYKYASDEQLDYVPELSKGIIENIDVDIALIADVNTKELSNVDPAKMARSRAANRVISQRFMERQATGELRWTLTQYPTPGSEQCAAMSPSEAADCVETAGMVRRAGPVAYWKGKAAGRQRVVDWLTGHDEVEVKGENIDLTLSIKDRVFINSDGKKNMP